MKIFDNTTTIIKDDLIVELLPNSKVSIAAACFSIYAYQTLKMQLDNIEELRFIFTSPAFVTERATKEKREFYIPRINRERSLYGTEFEVKLRNELTQRAIAKECADWIKQKVSFKSNVTNGNITSLLNIESLKKNVSYSPLNGFTTTDIGCERGNNISNTIIKVESPESMTFLNTFNRIWHDKQKLQDVTDQVLESITAAYKENAPEFIYFVTLYNIFNEFLEDISEDVLPNEASGFKQSQIWDKLYNFQQDAALAIINKLERYNGCILADSVGLGKTFTALAVIKYYENKNRSVLVLCPKKLSDNWTTFRGNYVNNPVATDRLRYDVLYHTDLSRNSGKSNGIDLSRIVWGNYDLVVIDESHNFRNGGQTYGEEGEKENRYLKLLNKVIRAGVKTKVLMLSATPVNNRFTDLKNQIMLACEGDAEQMDGRLDTASSLEEIIRKAQTVFNKWADMPAEERNMEALLGKLSFDFFKVLDSVTIARSRKHIEKYYDTVDIGKFPRRLKPLSFEPAITNLQNAISYNDIYATLMQLYLSVYTPSNFIQPSKFSLYEELNEGGLTQQGREEGIRRLMNINLLKRLESSVHAFRLTLDRIRLYIKQTLDMIDEYQHGNKNANVAELVSDADFDLDDQNTDLFEVGRKIKIKLQDMDFLKWQEELRHDFKLLNSLLEKVRIIMPKHDLKLQTLLNVVDNKMYHPINTANKKILIFTAFADTAEYLYDNLYSYIKGRYGLDTAMISGTVEGKSTVPKLKNDLHNILTCFSPISKEKHLLLPDNPAEIDVLIGTDCISEGQNLQDCDYLVNYDIHWNPVRIIQRFGRIDRIGSRNECIQLVNFWPNISLDEYINLKGRVEARMKASVMTSTGDDNPISPEEQGDLEYRKKQLERLKDEVVDIEDMQGGISIMDLGLNEFRMDLLEYIKTNPDIEKTPLGMHAVTMAVPDAPPGVIYVLKNINNSVNINDQNRLHPFYLVYISDAGNVICGYLSPKEMLDRIRLLCKGKAAPYMDLCGEFNHETDDGRNMQKYSDLLGQAISSIIDTKAESDLNSLFSSGGTTALLSDIKGLDDFEMICFLVVRNEK